MSLGARQGRRAFAPGSAQARTRVPSAALLLLLVATGCATTGPSRLDDATELPLDDPRIVALDGALRATARERRSLVGSAHLSLSAPDLRFSRPQRVAVQRPSWVRVEVLALFGQVAAILTTDGRSFQLYDPGKREVQRGRVEAGLLWQVARMDLEPEEAVGVLLGAPWQTGTVLVGARALSDGTLLLAYRNPSAGSRRIFEFRPPAYLDRVRERQADGSLVWEVVYDDYRDLDGRAFAHAIAIDFPRVEASADFRFEQAELNRALPSSAFELPRLPAN